MVRAIRGATTAENTRDDILNAAREMIEQIISRNSLKTEDMVCIMFSLTPDLDAVFPAVAVRELGICNVPLMDYAQPNVQNALKGCIRVMVLTNSDKSLDDMHHVYLKGAKALRPDLADK